MPMSILSWNGTGLAGSLMILVKAVLLGRRFAAQAAAGVEIQGLQPGGPRRPGVVLPPDVRSRLEHPRLRVRQRNVAFQMVLEKWQLDLLAIEFGRRGVELGVPERFAVSLGPAAMQPRSHDEHILRPRAAGFNVLINFQRAKQVLGIEPAADGHHSGADVRQVRPQIAGFPAVVVGFVLQHFVPERDLVLEVLDICVRQRPHLQEEFVAVGRVVLEVEVEFLRRIRRGRPKLAMKLNACGRMNAP